MHLGRFMHFSQKVVGVTLSSVGDLLKLKGNRIFGLAWNCELNNVAC